MIRVCICGCGDVVSFGMMCVMNVGLLCVSVSCS